MMERAGMMPLAGANTGRSDAAGTAGKAPERDEIEPGYLPVRQSPFDLRAIGRGFKGMFDRRHVRAASIFVSVYFSGTDTGLIIKAICL